MKSSLHKSITTFALILCVTLATLTPLHASDIQQQQSTIYPYRSTIELSEEFLTGGVFSQQIGQLGFTAGGGSTSVVTSTTDNPGILRRSTGAVSGTVAFMSAPPTSGAISSSLRTNLVWVVRLVDNDANTTVRIGSFTPANGNPPTHGVYIEKLDADTNWFCVTRNAGVETRVDSGVATTSNFTTFAYNGNNTSIQFAINNTNVCGAMTTNVPNVLFAPTTIIINSAAVSKSIDHDFMMLRMSGLQR